MKRRLFTFALAALTIGLLGSCSKINERIDGLDKRVYDLENNKIASVEQQIAAINQSIADLETIRTNIQNLKNAQEAQGQDITDLQAKDQDLEGKINDLRTYVDTELSNYATTDWANATFATLAVQAEIIADVAKLKQDLEGLDTKLGQDIANLKTYIEGWVNTQLSAYYKKAEIDVTVGELQAQITTLKEDSETNKTKIAELEINLNKLKQDLEEAKATIRIEYEAAIRKAIEDYNGTITETIQSKIDEVNATIAALTGRVTTLEITVAALCGDVDALKAMIQTVSIIPAYSNGSVKAEDGILTINCVITPKEAVESLTKENFTILTSESEVLTKSALYGTLTIAKDEDLVLDKTNGTATIKVDVSSVLPAEEDKALTVAVNIKNGISDFTTEFVPVYVYVAPAPVAPEGFVDLGVKDANGKPLFWAECNLGASNPEDYGDYFAWGETAPYYTTTGGWPATPTWKSGKDSGYAWQSYCGQSSFVEWSTPPYDATSNILLPAYDAATKTNSSWRTPTRDEFKALAASCVWIWTTDYNSTGKAGYIVYKAKNNADKGKANMNGTWKKWDVSQSKYVTDGASEATGYTTSDTHIFFPAAGNGNGLGLDFAGSAGCYWSSSLYTDDTERAYSLFFKSGSVEPQDYRYRFFGISVRPVTSGAAPAPAPLPAGALKGEFSVSATKKVRFSQGNLVATIDATGAPTAWKFAANQYDYLGEGGANKTIGVTAGDVDFFGWSTSTNGGTSTTDNYGIKTAKTASDYSGDFYDWGKAVGDGNTWHTLSNDEWTYLINKKCDENIRKGKYKYGVTVCNKANCLILAPDDFEGTIAESYDAAAWATAEAAGLVCLPAAGYRYGSSGNEVGSLGYYWSSSASNSSNARRVYFKCDDVIHGDFGRHTGYSVRLVTDVK